MRIFTLSPSLSRWIYSLIIAAVGLIAINFVWLIPTIRTIRSSASLFALEIADRAAAQVVFELENTVDELKIAGEDIVAEPERVNATLQRLLRKNIDLKMIAVVDRNGKELERVERAYQPEQNQLEYSKNPSFYIALQGSTNIGQIFLSPELEPHAIIAAPIRNEGKVSAVLVAELSFRKLLELVRTFKLKEGHLYLVDQRGLQIVHPDINEVLLKKNFINRAVVQKVIIDGRIADGRTREDAYQDNNETVFTVGVPIAIAKLGLFVEQPRRQAFAGEQRAIIFAIITVALGMAIFLIIMRNTIRLARINAVLEERNRESIISGKFLIRRDFELTATNRQLHDLLIELENVGKMLVRRDLELTRANAALLELDAIKSEFVSVAAHQLRTPLTSIKWTLASLLEQDNGPLNHAQEIMTENGLKATNNLIKLVNDLLNVARLEEGRFGFHFKPQSIAVIINALSTRFQKAADEKNITFRIELPSSLPLINCDDEKIVMVLDNLVDNAIKYTPPGGHVTITVRKQEKNIEVEIKDTGIGIPASQFHRIFTKFFRAQNALLYQTSGTGLGLYLAKNIIYQHGGTFTFESAENKGTVFIFTLPST